MKFNPIKLDRKAISYKNCWAKFNKDDSQSLSVFQHSINVGACCAEIISKLPEYLRDLIPLGMIALTAAHDVGKIAPCFQIQSKEWAKKYGIDTNIETVYHSIISEYALREMGVTDQLCEVIGFHHGWREYMDPPSTPMGGEIWQQERVTFLKDLEVAICEPLPIDPMPKDYMLAHKYFLSGLVVLSDWLGSSEEFYPLDWQGDFNSAKLRAKAVLKEVELFQKDHLLSFDFQAVFHFPPNELQKQFLEFFSRHLSNQGSTFVLRAPMGIGKTEMALAASAIANVNRESRGIFFGLPTTLTSDQIYLRLESFLSSVYLTPPRTHRIHSKAILYSIQISESGDLFRESALHASDWFGKSMKKAILAKYGAGTVDQALLGVLPVKHFFLRLFALAGKTVIFDEVHSYDAYTGGLLKQLLQMLSALRCNVIVMSATLTANATKKLLGVDCPSHNYPSAHFISSRSKQVDSVGLKATKGNSIEILLETINNDNLKEKIVEVIEKASRSQANVLWVCNSVASAQKIYRLLKSQSREGGPQIGLLHSRYLPADRKRIEEQWMSILGKNAIRTVTGSILVGTQVIEQSLDIDSDYLITELAPIDFILQRCGRLWRHNNKSRPCDHPVMTIVVNKEPDFIMNITCSKEIKKVLGVSSRIYCPYTLLRTLNSLLKRKRLDLPYEIQTLIESVYEDFNDDKPSWAELHKDRTRKEQELSKLSSVKTMVESLNCCDDEDNQILSTRYQEYETMSILAVDKIEGSKFRIDKHLIDCGERISAYQQFILATREIPVPSYRLKNATKVQLGFREYFVIETAGHSSWKSELAADNLIINYTADCGLSFERLEENDESCE